MLVCNSSINSLAPGENDIFKAQNAIFENGISSAANTYMWISVDLVNPSPPGKNGRHFDRWPFQMKFFNENGRIPIQISLKFGPKSPLDTKPGMIQVMAWCRTGDKPLPESMMTQFTDTYMRY